MKWPFYLLLCFILQHCASVSFVDKHKLHGDVGSLTVETYETKDGVKSLVEKTNYIFTKNGRVKFSQTFDGKNNLTEVAEKKLWFIKRSYPEIDPYYCKTRWKPKQRERISCYTQKQYKQNEKIFHYNNDGSIHKIVDNFTTFYTDYYEYDSAGNLSKIVTKDKEGNDVETYTITCKAKDVHGNCIDLEKKSTKTNTILNIISKPTYL